jgi:hypothetical protein
MALPGEHMLPWQASPSVQTLPSLQGIWLLANTQPVFSSQLSVVHGFWSSQTVATPGRQALPWQLSPTVQALPSLQDSWLLANTQPVFASQLSVVHGFWSLQAVATPGRQALPWQVSPTVQALPSLHAS